MRTLHNAMRDHAVRVFRGLLALSLALLVSLAYADTSSWNLTGSLNQGRANATATPLPSGQVLVAGGSNSSNTLTSAELYNPATGTWTTTGAMNQARTNHTATLLPNGQVLVTGGSNGNSALASTELYNPATGVWTPTGAMTQSRVFHTATLLQNGQVLVAGGEYSSNQPSHSAELYDPTTGAWVSTGTMSQVREIHTATLLQNGNVLIVGGFGAIAGTPLSTTELYHPTTGTWTVGGSIHQARAWHSATLLQDGTVLIAGGFIEGGDSLSSAEVYNPATDSWTLTGSLSQARYEHTTTLLQNGKVLLVGGLYPAIAGTEIYDPTTSTWMLTSTMNQARSGNTATLLPSGAVLVAGGTNSNPITYLSSAELYVIGNAVLAVTNTGTGNGTVTSSPVGINCGATCSASYAPDTSVTLTAMPSTGSSFASWSGACSGGNTVCTVNMDNTQSVTAMFVPTTYLLTVNEVGTGSGSVTSSPAGINQCASTTCITSFSTGANVTLTATPNSGSTFTGWSGSCSGGGACTVSMNAATSVTATFVAQTGAAIATPLINVAAGSGTSQTITITDATGGATIYYTLDGSTPTTASSRYTAPLSVAKGTTVNAIAVAGGYSSPMGMVYAILTTTPTLSPVTGSYTSVQTVTLSDATGGATIYYTLDGSTPTTASTQYTGPFVINQTTTVNAIAIANGYGASAVGSATYTLIIPPAPTISPPAGSYAIAQTVTLGDAVGGATLYYTLDGSTPTTASTQYTAPISVTHATTVKAIAIASGYGISAVASAAYIIATAAPNIHPGTGTYTGVQNITITDTTSGATIYYTLDGSTPTTTSPQYSGSFVVHQTTTVNAIAIANAQAPSGVSSATYTITGNVSTWVPTGTMNQARVNHTATLLPNGRVLVTGGDDGGGNALSSTETYDPTNGTWVWTGFMNQMRENHTATLLPSGTVLVTGGGNNSAELYDPASGIWTFTGSMTQARTYHTATLLQNGKVLVVGGWSNNHAYLASAELYDPATGTWTSTGAMNESREYHSATLLPSGKVLVVGGGYDAKTELYDPASGAWTFTGATNQAHMNHTASLLPNGMVLVAGGAGVPVSSAELYDPSSGAWSLTHSMNQARAYHTAILLPTGSVLISGGEQAYTDSRPIYGSSTEVYDPASATWSFASSMNQVRANHTAVLLADGRVLVAGGGNSDHGALNSAELYGATSPLPSVAVNVAVAGNGSVTSNPAGINCGMGGSTCSTSDASGTTLILTATPSSGSIFSGWSGACSGSTNPCTLNITGAANTTATFVTQSTVTQTAMPTFSPTPGSYTSAQIVTINDATSSAILYYTLDGSIPTVTSAQYTGPFTISQTTTVNAIAIASGYGVSTVASATYTIATATPTFGLAAGRYIGAQTVTLTDATNGATIYYTLDGSTPTTASTQYTGPFHITQNTLVNAIAVTGGSVSAVTTAFYTIATATPTFSPAPSNYTGTQTVTINDAISNASIYYTLDGSMPTVTSAQYTGPFTISQTTTVNAIAIASGYGMSAMASATYAITIAPPPNSNPDTWVLTGSMNQARANHTATLLQNGKVIVTGGMTKSGYLASVEQYDPADGAWSTLHTMNQAHSDHTATLLSDGTMLITGNGSAERYDPAGNLWTSTGAVNQLRTNHTATLLPSGQVLVVGGWSNGSYLASAEVYDPSSNTWTVTGSMNQGRAGHTATLLPNGKVLVAGGKSIHNGSYVYLTDAELYDPSSDTWSVTNAMSQARAYHTATLLPNGKVLTAGGEGGAGAVSSAEVYDPASGIWSATGAMNQAHEYHTATLLTDGRVFVTGGISNSAEWYDPSSNTWMVAGAMNQTRYLHTATLLVDGRVLVAGGNDAADNTLNSAELYTPGSVVNLTVIVTGNGGVTSSPAGINCGTGGATCSVNEPSGANVTLTATPSSGSVFSGWSGGCSGVSNTCIVSMTRATSVNAAFVVQTVAPTVSPTPGNYTGTQTVTLTDATNGAVIYYTLDGSTPTTASTQYTGPFAISQTTTVKTMAVVGNTASTVASATYTITLGKSQTIGAITLIPTTLSVGTTLTASANASSKLAVTFGSSTPATCTVSGNNVVGVAVGSCTITANQAGNATYGAATQVIKTLAVSKGTQTIGALTLSPATLSIGGSATISANATSGLAVTFSASPSSVCTISGNTVTGIATGTCTIASNQSGNNNYNAAARVTKSITVTKINQTIGAITLSPANLNIGDTTQASASADSNLTVVFTSSTPTICTVRGSTVTAVAAGTCTIAANQSGNGNYGAAAQVTTSVTIGKKSQTMSAISVTPTTLAVGTTTQASAIASSKLAVTFTSSTPTICTVSGSTVTGITAGTCIITAHQTGNNTYNAASVTTTTLTVMPGSQTIGAITFSPATLAFGKTTQVSATASTHLAVIFASVTPSVCTVNGNVVTDVTAGTCTITANQAGNANYNAAPQVIKSITVAMLNQTIGSITASPSSLLVTGALTVSANATSGLAVAFNASPSSVCTISGNTVTGVATGTCTITANQAGNVNYNVAPTVSKKITVSPITFPLAAAARSFYQSTHNFMLSATYAGNLYTVKMGIMPGTTTTFAGQLAALSVLAETVSKNGALINTVAIDGYSGANSGTPLGSIDLTTGEYSVAANQVALPTSATIGQSGQYLTETTYANSTKRNIVSTTTETWSLLAADTATTAWGCFNTVSHYVAPIVSAIIPGSAYMLSGATCYKIDTSGSVLAFEMNITFNGITLWFQ